MNIYIDESFFTPDLLFTIKTHFPDIHWMSDLSAANEVDVMIASPKLINKDTLDRMPKLAFIKLLTAGYDIIDLDDVKSRRIKMAYAKDVYSIQIAEDVFAKILYFNRHLGSYHEQSNRQEWKFIPSRHEIFGKTVGILGAGSIGREIAKRMKGFGARVIGYKKRWVSHHDYDGMYYGDEGLAYVLTNADYVIICLALNQDTYHLIQQKTLQMMKKDALLINIARGDIIDQKALADALNRDMIRGAALDVTSPEPLPKDHILWEAKHLLITPHQASSSPMMKERLMVEVIETMDRYLKGLPLTNLIS